MKNWIGQSFFRENPGFVGAKGTTKKAEALELFVYPNLFLKGVRKVGIGRDR